MEPQTSVAGDNIAHLRQGISLVERLGEERLTRTSDLCPGGTVGAHFRHCLDFYDSFLEGLESGRIDYDDRERDPSSESAPARAAQRFREVVRALEAIPGQDRDRPLSVRGDGSREGEGGWFRSTLGRELQFLLSHTIHHFALIGFMLRAGGFEVDASFGVAPSTLRYWAETSSPAS
jgi:uncharacterized damage-inducible protein DinB